MLWHVSLQRLQGQHTGPYRQPCEAPMNPYLLEFGTAAARSSTAADVYSPLQDRLTTPSATRHFADRDAAQQKHQPSTKGVAAVKTSVVVVLRTGRPANKGPGSATAL